MFEAMIQAMLNTPWAILPERLAAMQAVLALRIAAGADEMGDMLARAPAGAEIRQGAVAVLPLTGTIMPRGGSGLFEMLFGGTSLDRFRTVFRQALNDPSIGAIVLDVDSPGGSARGVQEMADEVFAARDVKPIVAVSNTMMASAAYWIASQATRVLASPSSETGSIGVYMMHLDLSRAYDAAGITPTLIAAGKYKTEGNEFAPLADEARLAWQTDVDTFYTLFTDTVGRGRERASTTVRNGFGEGRVLGAQAAKAEHLVDEVGTLTDAIDLAGKLASRRASSRAAALRLRTL